MTRYEFQNTRDVADIEVAIRATNVHDTSCVTNHATSRYLAAGIAEDDAHPLPRVIERKYVEELVSVQVALYLNLP